MRKQSIANRWFFNSFGVVAILLVVLNVAFYFIIRSFYYNSARQYIETEASIVAGVLERFYDDTSTDYTDEMRTAVEEFEKKNYAELMAINSQGKVFLSSSGFSPAESYTIELSISHLRYRFLYLSKRIRLISKSHRRIVLGL